MITIVAAMSLNKAIGSNGQLPWHIPEDLHRFKLLTTGKVVIMGRKTYQSIGRPLPNRLNIVLSRSPLVIPGAYVVDSLESAVALASAEQPNTEIFIIGGAQIYKQAIDTHIADRLLLTIVHQTVNDADTFFPTYENEFPNRVSDEQWTENNGRSMSFLEYHKN